MATVDLSNTTLAQFGAIVMDTLHGYGNMPAFENIMVTQRRTVSVTLHGPSVADTVRALTVWADTFHAPVSIAPDSGHVTAEVEMHGVPLSFREFVGQGYACRLVEAIGVPFQAVEATAVQVAQAVDVAEGGEPQ